MAKGHSNPVDAYVGSRVRMGRMMRGISQEALANAIGVTFQQVQKYEKGANRIGSSRLQQIANALQVQVTFFFEGVPGQVKIAKDAPSPAYVSEFLATSDGLALVKSFMKIKNTSLRRKIVDVVKELTGKDGVEQ